MLKKPNRIPRLDLPFVPDSARSDVLQWAHNSKLTCHPRTTRTIQFIQQPFWWLQFLCWSLGGTLRPSCPLSRFPVISTTSAAHLLSISLHHCLHLSLPDPGLHCQSINVHPWYTGSLLAHAVTLHLSSMPSGYLSPSYRIRQPVKDTEECTCPTSTSPDHPKELQLQLNSPCEKCYRPAPPPKISDLLNDKDLLDLLRLKLDPNHCTVKNWKNFASRWGMSYDELTLLEHRTQGSLSHSPTQEFLLRYNQKPVAELTELCRFYQRIDVLRLLQGWIENDWPSRWQQRK
ncbi:uncharacterized protein edaradd isoform X2 [Phyllopteryx taeniolatus]|uniref:uncharacterized protein edaradd isoform X2 n=1 Tax=Phyllopteryx taeniolatus TaxID=161469 RepID=UPI002AD3739C|nr:uncharacterized protein edaradd isoform X2 [Phyllopteryx taeniolatus]